MVTYSDLIQIGILIVGIVGLFIQAKKSDRRHPDKFGDHIVGM